MMLPPLGLAKVRRPTPVEGTDPSGYLGWKENCIVSVLWYVDLDEFIAATDMVAAFTAKC